jgi:catechol 2,3-dioxygenase-like lactoylglutathione lyase family enzyme
VERVNGIGGIFFRSSDPKALVEWYRDHLGIEPQWETGTTFVCGEATGEGAMTVWSPFPADTDYFGAGGQSFMINYRVSDLAAMVAQLSAAGVVVEDQPEASDFGRFAWATDPQGNRFELWEPASGEDAGA